MNHTSLENNITAHLEELIMLVNELDDQQYTFVPDDKTASVGRHVRHTVEIFLLLVDHYDTGKVNYENRARDLTLEENRTFAASRLQHLKNGFSKPDKSLKLFHNQMVINTSYHRELLYQLEHIIHHNAIIRPTITQFLGSNMSANFGYAPSTIKYQAKHVSG